MVAIAISKSQRSRIIPERRVTMEWPKWSNYHSTSAISSPSNGEIQQNSTNYIGHPFGVSHQPPWITLVPKKSRNCSLPQAASVLYEQKTILPTVWVVANNSPCISCNALRTLDDETHGIKVLCGNLFELILFWKDTSTMHSSSGCQCCHPDRLHKYNTITSNNSINTLILVQYLCTCAHEIPYIMRSIDGGQSGSSPIEWQHRLPAWRPFRFREKSDFARPRHRRCSALRGWGGLAPVRSLSSSLQSFMCGDGKALMCNKPLLWRGYSPNMYNRGTSPRLGIDLKCNMVMGIVHQKLRTCYQQHSAATS